MPISRYEVRNEYSLADPEMYRAADKDDPEALLEGVAMAGLVGVLRQLGDLAEFAADIFHNLHEEVMATAARGHGLMGRVQQLETEIPSIERAFLAQTDHSSFFTHPGVDWHPNLRIDQNLITQGDLPRLVMDSYEECRPPPRLFILDKFDVAGAGACLKRYTDPSFFKVENSRMAKADVPREKKIRKAKKKGPRWKNRETPEVLPPSHTKLHQLFLEEARIESNVINPARRVKLKRKLNGFPFNSKPGKSYMEKLLQHPSPDNKKITFEHNESGLEVIEVRPVCRDRENVGRKRSPPCSPDRESDEVVNLYRSISTNGDISSTPDEKVIAVDDESNRESYQSDDIVSEVDNYVDAISNTESDTDADSKSRVNNDFTSSHVKNESLISDVNDENLQIGSLDSQSTGGSTISDDGNNSPRKGMSSSIASGSPSTSAENPRSERISSRGFSSDHIPEVDASFYHKTDDDDDYDDDDNDDDDDETDFTLDDEEKKSNLVMEPPCPPSVSDSDLQSGDESRRSSAGEYAVDEPDGENIPCVSAVPFYHYRTTDSSDKVTPDSLHGDEYEQEERNSVENIAFEINNFNSQNANGTPSELPPSENLFPAKLDDDFQRLPIDISSYYPEIVHNGDSIKSTVLEEQNLTNGYNEDSRVLTDSPNQFPSSMDTFLKKKLEEPSLANAQTIDSEDDQIFSENLMFLHQVNSSDWPQAGIEAHEGDVPDKETTVNETLALETPNDLEVQERPFSTPGELLEPTGTSEYVEMDGRKFNDLEVTEISGSADLKSQNEDDMLFGKPDSGEDTSNTADIASAVRALSENFIIVDDPSPVGLNNLELEDSGVDELENGVISLPGSREESGKVDQIVLCNTIDNDNPKSDILSGTVPNAHLNLEVDQDLKFVHREITQPPVEQSLLDRECESENSIIQEEFWSLPSQLDQELLHSGEKNSEVPAVLPITYQQTPDHDYLEEDNKSELDFSKDTLDSVPPPSNPFSEPNPTNLGDLAPLPPLPPAQWMMGKLELGSSSTEGETMRHDKLLFPQFISHPVVPTEEKKKPLIQIADEPASKEEKVIESSCAEDDVAPETVDLLPKSEKKQLIILPAISENEFADELASKVEKVIESSCAEVNAMPETVDLLPRSEKKQQLKILRAISESELADEPASKEEKVIESLCAEVNTTPKTVDLLPKSLKKQQLIIVPAISESEFASLAEKDGVGNGSRTVKLPRPRHPLIDEFTALDKSKLRKVTERIMPQVQKVDERNTLLEQIRTKSFNLKPALASRPSVRGPSTNLQVAAIVEKANAIRQAFADSDEDDDSWSDS